MSALSPARVFALRCLIEARRDGSFAREVAEGAAYRPADARDAALGLRLVLGVTATSGVLDEFIDRFLTRPRDVAPAVRDALRIAAFEILCGGAPSRVAVSQGVELVRSRVPRAAGLANAVLRRAASARTDFLAAADFDEPARPVVAAARRAGLPVWLTGVLLDALGEGRAALLFAGQLDPALPAAHANPLRGLDAARFAAADGEGDPTAGALSTVPGALVPARIAELARSGAFVRGDAVASDLAAQLVATASTAPGSCLEIGAGRGTKTFIMACQALRAGFAREHVALDLYKGKCRANLERLERAGLTGTAVLAGDACALDDVLAPLDAAAGERRFFDAVLVDAPCSGTGTMRRHPEIPWRLESGDVAPGGALPTLQLRVLKQAASRVAPGGMLVYATCSVLPAENADVVAAFLASEEGRAFDAEPLSEAPIFREDAFRDAGALAARCATPEGFFQTVPSRGGMDGHFAARLGRSR